ncbi:dinucleotide-utilizing enzyme possibly involved in molybdopterin or thiamin biosynthesis [Thioflavicoccus mobilis 8321]|uniref:Dinucleotide-utilizing enzyme possibly involved in molybdopterin or thiamin biosynthesis n=1 Tax=Thioflavicoccus mobilis 8321 TaxID=765912 RepID=L0GVE0_9GAMM|nr:ThiF family adenylyltransferase [Thioflavicoccus mobilis]AGA90723.1 dinucleotide-utilizing enzyme possibly involved in molybdopterin or thiamin biosynthesis [Thioflavicoccus mobilis 8321]
MSVISHEPQTEPATALAERTRIVVGDNGIARLAAAQVLVVGLGGVGAYAAEALARAGVGRLTVVDGDLVAPSNLNRQLLALGSTIGRRKVEVMAERLADINPACRVTALDRFVGAEEMVDLVADGHDQVLDAIDSLSCKLALLEAALRGGVPVASSMGAGGRSDPARLHLGDLMDSRGCPLAREVRQRLRRRGLGRGVLAVWSDEPPCPPLPPEPVSRGRPRAVNGTLSYLPALFGLMLAGAVVKWLLAPE